MTEPSPQSIEAVCPTCKARRAGGADAGERLREALEQLTAEAKRLVDRSEELANNGEAHRADISLARGRELEGAVAVMRAALATSPSPAPNAQLMDETYEDFQKRVSRTEENAWLIERGGMCLGFCEYRLTWVTFTNEDALRFSRKRDAYSFMEALKWKPFNMHLEGAIVTEHMWNAAPRTLPDSTPSASDVDTSHH